MQYIKISNFEKFFIPAFWLAEKTIYIAACLIFKGKVILQ